MTRKKRRTKIDAKNNFVAARFNNVEMHEAIKKAHQFAGGEMSELIRKAVAAYKGA